MTSVEIDLTVALVLFASMLVLGAYSRHAPLGPDAAVARATFGHGEWIAWQFSRLGYARMLGGILLVVGGVVYAFARQAFVAFAVLAVAQVISQTVADGLKLVFKRGRPERWLRRQETNASYPSGHSTTAIVTFLGLALGFAEPFGDPFPAFVRVAIFAVCVTCAIGIPWSRLALGAHYLTDVVGGILLGSTTLALVASIVER